MKPLKPLTVQIETRSGFETEQVIRINLQEKILGIGPENSDIETLGSNLSDIHKSSILKKKLQQ